MPVCPTSVRIDLARDQLLDDFSRQTLKERYLVAGETSPQEAFARASAAFADDAAHAQRIYDYASKGWFSFATPLLSNGGTKRGLPISCFLTAVEDSRAGIFDHWTEVGWLSSVGGGVGAYFGDLRSNGEKTSHGSSSTGIVPFIGVDDRLILSVSQGGTRRGSLAIYLDIDHPEIEEFITIRKPTGGDANRKALNIHNAVNVTDEFMEHLRTGKPFPLRSPKTKEVIRTVNPRTLWQLILETRMQTGEPYLHFIDTTNRHLPATQKAKGLKVRQSNLCVAPETEILTRQGYVPIAAMEDAATEVWNGQAWSTVTVKRTAEQAELVRVWFADGGYLDCTPEHEFYLEGGVKVKAGALPDGARLEAVNHPLIDHDTADSIGASAAYTAGFATFAGFEDEGRLTVYAPSDLGDEGKRRLAMMSKDVSADDDGLTIRCDPSSVPSGYVPLTANRVERLAWLAGAFDAVGEWTTAGDGGRYLAIASPDADMIMSMRLMALELGLAPVIRLTDAGSVFLLPAYIAKGLLLASPALVAEPVSAAQALDLSPVVTDVHPLPWKSPTFCFTEPARGRGVFAGVLTGQCTEITLPSGRDDQGKKRTAVCCLSSVNAEKYREWKHEPLFIADLMRMLDNVLQVFIDEAPEELEYARYSARMERSVGLGCLGFHYLLQSEDIAFESEAARALNVELFRHIRIESDLASLQLGAERGESPDMLGTGHRFAHRRAVAPNASSSILLNTSPSIEPIRANAYLHKTLSGSFTVRNPYLVRKLEALGMNTPEVWKSINANEGSVKQLDFLTDQDRAVFKTATELDMWWVVRLAADRGGDIDQAQSVNLFYSAGTDARVIMRDHWNAWAWGLKSLYYLRSTTAKRAENVGAKVARAKTVSAEDNAATEKLSVAEASELAMAALSPMADSTCISCEG